MIEDISESETVEEEPGLVKRPGDCGSVSNQEAWLLIKDDVNTNFDLCFGLSTPCTSIFGVNERCASRCMRDTYGFSALCSRNFGIMAACGYDNCKWPCISGDPNAPSCVECNERECGATFHEATGIFLECQQYRNCNGVY